ncbi:MAG: hypothetical protein AAF993_07120 [Pseudomonadota bacterium]
MKTRLLTILVACVVLSACAGTLQTASMSEAYKQYHKGNFEKTLTLITQAENARPMDEDQRARMTYLKARTYAELGDFEMASVLYTYLLDQHADSQYAYLAREAMAAREPS